MAPGARRACSGPSARNACRSPKWITKTNYTQREPAQRLLQHRTAFGITNKRDWREHWRAVRAFRELQEFSSVEGPALVLTFPTSIGWVGALCRCFGLLARSLQCVPGHVTQAHFSLKEGASRIKKALLQAPGLPTWNCSGSVGPCPRGLRHLLSFWPVRTTWHTVYTEPASTPGHFSKTGRDSSFV